MSVPISQEHWGIPMSVHKGVISQMKDSPKPCYVCGGPVGTFDNGFGSYSGPATMGETVYLCHPNNPNLPDCYSTFCRSGSLDAALALTNHWLQRREVSTSGQADAGGEQEGGGEVAATRQTLLALREVLVAVQQGDALRALSAGDQPASHQEDLSRIDFSQVRSIEILDERPDSTRPEEATP